MPTTAGTLENKQASQRKLPLERRCRSVPYRRPFIVAILYTLVFYIALVGFVTLVVTFFLVPQEMKRIVAYLVAAMLPACGILWTISYFKRRKASCPLCKCTPFLDNLAHKHQKAFKVRPFNHGTTAVFNVVLSQRWRCMYCGTPFDILKTKK
jgi:hypothetical protein